MRKAWHSQQRVALGVPCKPAWRVCRHSGVGLATGERRAAQVRGIHQLALQIRLVCLVAGFLPFCHPLLDPHKACRRDSASWCSAAAAQKHLSQPSVVSVEAGPQRKALTKRECGDVVQLEDHLGKYKASLGLVLEHSL